MKYSGYISAYRVAHSGMLVLSAMVNGQTWEGETEYQLTRKYIGYSVLDAKASFRQEVIANHGGFSNVTVR